jgi:hypothetical protein
MRCITERNYLLALSRRRFTGCLGMTLCAMASPAVLAQIVPPHDVSGGLEFWNPMDYGAQGDGRTKDTAAIQRAIDACAKRGGGTVILPAGHIFLSGTLTLCSHVEMHLAGGSTLLASPERDDFRALGALLFAKDASDIRISGTGTIDGNFQAFFPPKGPEGYSVPQPFLGPYDPLNPATDRNPPDGRPRMILLVNCRKVQMEAFTIRDSPTWTIHPLGCEDVAISGISILNRLDVPNCDGIDIDHCKQVRIDSCNIVAGDDCLVLKASRNFGEYGACEGVTITNCTLESSSAGVKIEAEGPYPIRSAVVSNCTIVRSNRGISLLNRDGATVEDLMFTNMTIETKMRPMMWWGSGEPIALSSVPRSAGGPAGLVRGVKFANMQCRSESGVYLRGSKAVPLYDIGLSGIDLEITKTTGIEGGFYDMRPGDAFGLAGLDRRPTAGLFAADVSGLELNGLDVRWGDNAPSYYGAAVELHRCSGVSAVQVTGRAAREGTPSAILDNVTYDASTLTGVKGKP